MNSSQMKNMVIIKDVQSNIIDEAFVILKNNVKIKSLERVEKSNNTKEIKIKQENFIIKEAEMVINNFLSNMERQKQQKDYKIKQIQLKYKRLKMINLILSCIIIINIICLCV